MNVCLFYHIIKTTGIFSAVYTIEQWSIRNRFLSSLIASFQRFRINSSPKNSIAFQVLKLSPVSLSSQMGDILKHNSVAPLILSQQNSKRIGKPSTTIFRNSNYTYN